MFYISVPSWLPSNHYQSPLYASSIQSMLNYYLFVFINLVCLYACNMYLSPLKFKFYISGQRFYLFSMSINLKHLEQ